MADIETVNIALIGHRFMGKAHTHGYTDVTIFFEPKVQPVKQVLCARSGDLPDTAQKWNWKDWEFDWRKVINRSDVDAVDICAPGKIHKDIAIAAAEAGKHIFCEKPLALNLEDAREMLEAVEHAEVVHGIGFNYRKVPALALAKQFIDEGKIGRIFHFRGIYSQDWLVDPGFPLAWRLRKEDAGGGSSWDLGAHVVDLARFLVGDISEVIGSQSTFIKERPVAAFEEGLNAVPGEEKGEVDVDDATSVLVRFENEAMGLFEMTRYGTGHRNENRIEVYGSEGAIIFNMERMNELEFYSRSDPDNAQGYRTIQVGESSHPYVSNYWPAGHIIGYGDTFVHEALDFLNAIAEGTDMNPSFDDGVKAQEVLVAVDKSVTERRWVSLGELR